MRTRHPALLWLAVAATPLTAQQPLIQQASNLVDRVERGETGARGELAVLTRDLIAAAQRHPDDAEAQRAAARAALAMAGPLSPIGRPVTSAERQWRPAAVRALRAALKADGGDVGSAMQLETIAPYPAIWTDPDEELRQLRTLASRRGMPAMLQLTLARLELERGSLTRADSIVAALPDGAVSRAVRAHLEAELAFARHNDQAGRDAYLAGAAAIADDTDMSWYTRDLLWIASPKELAQWRSLRHTDRRDWLQRFWTHRDLVDAQFPGTRLPEQFRRWRLSLREYRWELDGISAEGTPIGDLADPGVGDDFPADAVASAIAYNGSLGPASRIIDDRGRMVLRHGEPDEHANLPGIQSVDMETLAWATPGQPLLLGFSRPSMDGTSRTRFGMILRNRPMGDMMSLCKLDSRLCIVAAASAMAGRSGSRIQAQNGAARLRLEFADMRERAETTDGNAETFEKSLGAVTQAYGVPGGGTLVVVAIPASGLMRNGAGEYQARIRVLVADSLQSALISGLDTVRTWRAAKALHPNDWLSSWFLLPTPPGSWDVSVVIGDTLHHAGTGERFLAVPAPAFDGVALQLSDPILGRTGAGLEWAHEGRTIALNPTNAWRRDDPAPLHFELDGLVPSRAYETRIELWQADGHPRAPKNAIASSEQATARQEVKDRELSLRELSPGDYRLVVIVRDAVTGQEVRRERRLAVRR